MSSKSQSSAFPISRYLQTRDAFFPAVSSDNRQLAFITNITGVPQVWGLTIPPPGEAIPWPDQLTFAADRVMGAWYSPAPGDFRLIYAHDIGGNENAQLFLLDTLSGTSRPLTQGYEGAMHTFGTWSRDGSRILFAANRRDPALFDLYLGSLDGEARMVWQNDQPGYLINATFSPDEKFALVVRMFSSFKHELFEVDLDSGAARNLTPGSEQARFDYSYGNPVKYIDPDGHCPKPASGLGNVICVDLFIQSKTIVFGLGRGDNRGFDTNSAPEASRAYAYIYLDDSGNVIGSEVSVNQSCTVVGCFGPADEFNDFSVSQESAGGDINITWNLLNGVSGELREHANEAYEGESSIGAMPLYSNIVLAGSYGLASINGEMTLSLGDGGNYQITSLDRDPYPSLEVYFYKNGDYQYTLGQFKERYGPFIGLSPIAPNQRITAR